MGNLTQLLSLRRSSSAILSAAESAWDSFAGWGDWKQKGDRMVSPSGKRSLTLPVFEKLKGRAPAKKGGAEKAKGAPKAKEKAAPLPKGQPKPGEAAKIAQAVAKEATAAVGRAKSAGVTGAELAALQKRADVAAARAKSPQAPSPTLSVASLPRVPDDSAAVALQQQMARELRVPLPKAPARKPVGTPKNPIADPNPVLRRAPTQVQGKPIVATDQTNRTGVAAGKASAAAVSKVKPIPPKSDGTPDVKALRDQVESGIVSNAATGWNYDFKAAKAALSVANGQIDDYYRKFPRKMAGLAEEVTGEKPKSTEDAVALLKSWVAETLDLLEQKPSKRERRGPGGRATGMSERGMVSWFAEAGRRVGMVRVLFAALAA